MLHIDPTFLPRLTQLGLDSFRQRSDVIFMLDADLLMRGYNDPFIRFAEENGAPELPQRFGFGVSLLDAINDSYLRSFYRERFGAVTRDGKPFFHEYECSSDQLYRKFFQSVYPLVGLGMIITNQLLVSHQHLDPAVGFSAVHVNSSGIITQCSHCRKIRNTTSAEQWDWVPTLLELRHPNISHSICPCCIEKFYPLKDDTKH